MDTPERSVAMLLRWLWPTETSTLQHILHGSEHQACCPGVLCVVRLCPVWPYWPGAWEHTVLHTSPGSVSSANSLNPFGSLGCLGTALLGLTGLLGLLSADTQREQGSQNTHVHTGRVLISTRQAIGGDTPQLTLMRGGGSGGLNRGPLHIRRC